jgi:hypothetical protein
LWSLFGHPGARRRSARRGFALRGRAGALGGRGGARGAGRLVLARARPHEARVDRVGHVDALAGERVVELAHVRRVGARCPARLVERERRAQPARVVALLELGLEVRAARLVAVRAPWAMTRARTIMF